MSVFKYNPLTKFHLIKWKIRSISVLLNMNFKPADQIQDLQYFGEFGGLKFMFNNTLIDLIFHLMR